MQTTDEQRRAVLALRYRAETLVDAVFADLPERWFAIVDKHAERGADGVARIPPAARRAILAECEATLADLDAPLAALVGAALARAIRLPREAVG